MLKLFSEGKQEEYRLLTRGVKRRCRGGAAGKDKNFIVVVGEVAHRLTLFQSRYTGDIVTQALKINPFPFRALFTL